MIQHVITAIVNLLSFFSVETNTSALQPFLAAFFVFACSIFLEAMGLHDNLKRESSFIICIFTIFLYVTSLISIFVSSLGILGFVQFELLPKDNKSTQLFLGSTDGSLLYISQLNLTPYLIGFGFAVTLIPLLLCARIVCIQKIRKDYVLTSGFFGK